MSQENVEVVRRMYDAFHTGDAEGALAHFDPHVIVDASRSGRPDIGIGRGPEQVRRMVISWVGTWDQWREEIEEMRDLGSQVLVLTVQHGRGRGSGVEVEASYAVLYDLHGGKITRMALYREPADALQAAGRSRTGP
jgi:ketosteroid isomerase-like protein